MPTSLDALLAQYSIAYAPLGPPTALGNAGGLSGSRLYRIETGRGPFLVRGWPIDGRSIAAIERIHGWLRIVAGLGFIPSPVQAVDGRTAINWDGQTWEICPWIVGEPDRARPPSETHVRAALSALAAFHTRLGTVGGHGRSPGIQARRTEVERLQFGELKRLEALIANSDDAYSPLGRRWLTAIQGKLEPLAEQLRRVEPLVVPIQPCLRDARPDHFLFDGERLAGLIDFGAMDMECPAADLARLLPEWLGHDPFDRSVALDTYESIRPLEPAERRLMQAFEHSQRILGPARWLRWRFVDGRSFAQNETILKRLETSISDLELWVATLTSKRGRPLG